MNPNDILTVNEVAEYLRMNPMTIYRFAQQGRIPASKVMGSWRFRRTEIDQWLKSQEVGAPNVLVINNDSIINEAIKEALEKKHIIINVKTADDARKAIKRHKPKLILIHINTDNEIDLLKEIKQQEIPAPVVVVIEHNQMSLLSIVVKEGAQFILDSTSSSAQIRQLLDRMKY